VSFPATTRVPGAVSEQKIFEPSLEEKISFLQDPAGYPDHPPRVDAIDTHMSRVFLAGRYAYKLKKPVQSESLDLTSLDARRHNCEEEIRLNRRLAPQVYLGLSTLTVDPAGRLSLDGSGTVVDYLVRMRRLLHRQTLEQAIRRQSLREDDVRAVAALLVRFYARAPSVLLRPQAHWLRFLHDIDANRRVLLEPAFGLSAAHVERVCALQLDALHRLRDVIESKARDGKVIEAHGDLRPEHVYLGSPPVIIDCLEFRRELRLLDPVDDLAFLALESDRLGAPQVEHFLFDGYRTVCGDRPSADLVHFYKSFRAAIRARLAALHMRQREFARSPRWAAQANEYLELALEHATAVE